MRRFYTHMCVCVYSLLCISVCLQAKNKTSSSTRQTIAQVQLQTMTQTTVKCDHVFFTTSNHILIQVWPFFIKVFTRKFNPKCKVLEVLKAGSFRYFRVFSTQYSFLCGFETKETLLLYNYRSISLEIIPKLDSSSST